MRQGQVQRRFPSSQKISIANRVRINDAYYSGEGSALLQCVDFGYWTGDSNDGKDEGEKRKEIQDEFVHCQTKVSGGKKALRGCLQENEQWDVGEDDGNRLMKEK